ncbi:18984_t:CDS:10 [Racocetra fulgida]|uniref:18984_t:CDS:1 n=1 Tax=Racocetra fulgida TaxID=60492 RepID=A0A9N9F988_9GLOM|nr:18984_t:CDS:10 [Racocetra fulgida]
MDPSARKNGVPKTQKAKTPPTPKPKPPKLSTAPSNRIDSEPNSSSTHKQSNPNTIVVRGPNINRLSSVFEDPNLTADQTIIKSRVAPSLPLSPKLPVPMVKKTYIKKSVSRDNFASEKKANIDESSLIFDDIKAKFQQADESDVAESDSSEDGVDLDWVDIPYINQVLEMNEGNNLNDSDIMSQTSNSSISKNPGRNNSHSAQSSKRNSIVIPSNDFEAKRASIANLLSGSSPILVRPKDLHLETSKALPPIPTQSPSQSPSIKVISPLSDKNSGSKSEISLTSFSSETTLVEEDEYSIDLKRRKKLWNVIKELVETERVFFQDMVLLEKYDCKTIFSNLPDIIDFSEHFLNLLLVASGIGDAGDDPEKHYELENDTTSIGEAFAQMGEDCRLEAVYGEYCKRHEAAVQKLQEFDNDDEVQGFLQPMRRSNEKLGYCQSFNKAGAARIEISTLIANYEHLKFSFSEITKVAERINEIKRRKDIVEKIVGSKKKSDADHATGIAKPTEDELYKAYVAKFKTLEQTGIQLSKDVKNWVKHVKNQQRLAAAIEDFYILGVAANKNSDDCIRIVEYVKAPDKSLQQSADAYVSISAQLHEELPMFFIFITDYFDIIVQELIKIQAKFYRQMDMDFRQYFYKFVDIEALKQISDDRELVLRDIDITTEYTDYFHGSLGMEDRLNELFILNNKPDFTSKHRNGRRSSFSESLGSSGSSKQAEDSQNRTELLIDVDNLDSFKNLLFLERSSSWYSDNSLNSRTQNSFGFDDSDYENRSKNFLDDGFNFQEVKNRSQQRYSAHKKYATDGVINHSSLEDDDDVFHDSLTGEEGDETLFLCQTIHTNKSKEKNELNFKPGILLKIIHIDECGEWWFAVNEDTGERGWVDPAFVERIG